ncbi:MAG TPA: hypothetical protein VNS22_11015 [Geminicoccus sp.]|nr:hypothetical protein [Geminicoccus sp.]HWL68902.1 hypothetical protein [Geminicoccus sp.]
MPQCKPAIDRRYPAPRLTRFGVVTIMLYAGLPVLLLGLCLDVLFWLAWS